MPILPILAGIDVLVFSWVLQPLAHSQAIVGRPHHEGEEVQDPVAADEASEQMRGKKGEKKAHISKSAPSGLVTRKR